MILIVSTGATWRVFHAESFRWISMQIVAQFYPKCAISQNMKSQGMSVLQHNGKQDLILILKFFLHSYNLHFFVTKEWQYHK